MPNAKMRQTLAEGGMVVAPGAYDVPTARLIRNLGFEYLYVPGSQTGTVLGTTEPLTTLTQMAEMGRTVARACREELPVIVDAGAGFGDPVHVVHAVRTFELAGVTAVHIEDQFYPKRVSYHRGLEHVVPIETYQQRIAYAVKGRRSKDFLIIARNDGFVAAPDAWLPNGGGREEAVKRAHAAIEVGADVIMVVGVQEREDFAYFRENIKDVPLVALTGHSPQQLNMRLSLKDFESLGYQIVIFPSTTYTTALNAINSFYSELLETGKEPDVGDLREFKSLGHTLTEIEDKWAVEEATTGA